MDLLWQPTVHSRSRIEIPEVLVRYLPETLEQWKAKLEAWQESGCKDFSVWGEYRSLAEAERLYLPTGRMISAQRFAEFHTALLLEREGFTCWGGVQLFRYGKDVVKGQENTNAVRDIWEKSNTSLWPDDIRHTLDLPLGRYHRNPDIVAYGEDQAEWRFCEVKWKDPVAPDQLSALAVLHLLTGAPVAVVRVVPEDRGRKTQCTSYEGHVTDKGDARLDWIRDSDVAGKGSD